MKCCCNCLSVCQSVAREAVFFSRHRFRLSELSLYRLSKHNCCLCVCVCAWQPDRAFCSLFAFIWSEWHIHCRRRRFQYIGSFKAAERRRGSENNVDIEPAVVCASLVKWFQSMASSGQWRAIATARAAAAVISFVAKCFSYCW